MEMIAKNNFVISNYVKIQRHNLLYGYGQKYTQTSKMKQMKRVIQCTNYSDVHFKPP